MPLAPPRLPTNTSSSTSHFIALRMRSIAPSYDMMEASPAVVQEEEEGEPPPKKTKVETHNEIPAQEEEKLLLGLGRQDIVPIKQCPQCVLYTTCLLVDHQFEPPALPPDWCCCTSRQWNYSLPAQANTCGYPLPPLPCLHLHHYQSECVFS